MLHDDDLKAAVADGIVTEAQAESLRALAHKRDIIRAVEFGHEERFRFMRGFNDFFFAVGIALFAGGMGYFALPTPAGCLIAAVIAWALAELLVARLRLVLPGILLACIFVGFAMIAAPVDWFMSATQHATLRDWFTGERLLYWFNEPPQQFLTWLALAIYSLVGVAAAALFYARFRLPFALLLIAGCLVAAAWYALHHLYLSSPQPPLHTRAFTLLGCGLLTFAAAMAFDLSDRERLTRRADCAFWLHLLAAPLIVHSLITMVAPQNQTVMTTPVAVTILAIFAGLTIIAVVIDRRALLVSALLYVGTVVAYGIGGAFGTQSGRTEFVVFATLLVLGTLVLTLGVGWQPLRRLLLRILPAGLSTRLPPVATG